MSKEMLINVSEGEECRIALLEDGKLEELYMERTSSTSHVGNIYKGRVTNVEPSIQAAFVDFGLGRNGFLHISDLMPTYFGRRGEEVQESVGRKMARRDRPPIQRCLRRGDEIVVQIIKEGIGTKGPTLTTYLSVPGKILVMMPGMDNTGVSRKIEDEEERRRLRQILDQLKPPDDAGFIIRTAGVGATKTEIQRDLTYLTRLWANFKKKRDSGAGPIELYTEGDLVTRTVRDVFTPEVDKLVIDNKDVAKRVKDVIKLSNPRTKNKVELYEEPIPLFTKYGIEREIEMMYSRHVPLPSGGSLVIDSTEAIVAIDVNSGKFRDHSDAETTAFKTDMEAADEICRQLKLRDLGGVIICDFIDLRYERHRRELEKRLHDNLKDDRAKTKVLRMSQFGIIEMTRQRMRPSLKRSVYFDCPHCKGAGLVKTHESMSLDVMRRLRIAINDMKVQRIELAVCPDVAFYLQNKKRHSLSELERQYDKRILIRSDIQLGLDEMKIDLFDNRDGLVYLESLGMLAQPPHTTQLGTKPQPFQQRGGRGGGRDDRGSRGGRRPEPQRQQRGGGGPRHEEEDLPEERFDRGEDDFEREPDHDEHDELQRQPAGAEARGDHRGDPRGGQQRDQRGPRDQRNAQRGRQDQPRRDRDDRVPGGGGRSIHEEAEEAPGLETEAGGEAADVTEAGLGHPQRGGDAGHPANGQGEEGGGGRRRRRRRRGRRGRGRNRQGAEGVQPPADNGYGQAGEHSSENRGYPLDESAAEPREGDEEDATVAEGFVEEDVIQTREPEQATTGREEADAEREDRRSGRAESRESSPDDEQPEESPAAAEGFGPTASEAEEIPAEKKPKRRRGTRGGSGRSRGRKKAAVGEAKAEEPTRGESSKPAPVPEPEPVRTGSTDRHLIEDEPAYPQTVRRPRSARDLDSIPDDYD